MTSTGRHPAVLHVLFSVMFLTALPSTWSKAADNPSPAPGADQPRQYDEFKPLDGKFAENVILQIINGTIDFQPREPYSPLLAAMENTNMMMEFQVAAP